MKTKITSKTQGEPTGPGIAQKGDCNEPVHRLTGRDGPALLCQSGGPARLCHTGGPARLCHSGGHVMAISTGPPGLKLIRGAPAWLARGTPVIKLRDGPSLKIRGKPPLGKCIIINRAPLPYRGMV